LHGSLQEEPSYPRAKKAGWILPTLAILLAGLGAGGYYLWTEGYGYRWAFPDSRGELRVSVRIAKADKPAGDLYMLARALCRRRQGVSGTRPIAHTLRAASHGRRGPLLQL
jgi:hypothetical protein